MFFICSWKFIYIHTKFMQNSSKRGISIQKGRKNTRHTLLSPPYTVAENHLAHENIFSCLAGNRSAVPEPYRKSPLLVYSNLSKIPSAHSFSPPQSFKGIRRTPRFLLQAITHHTVRTPRFPLTNVSIPLPHGTHDVTTSLPKAPFRSVKRIATRDDVTTSLRKAPFRSVKGIATRDDVTTSLQKAPFRSKEGLATHDDVTPSLRKA
ncbi:unnamed protein product [Prunus armeniaca]